MKSISCIILLSAALVSAMEMPVAMEDGKSVEINRGLFGDRFLQDGKMLRPGSMYAVLESHPDSREAAVSSKHWMWPGMALGATGGFLMGFTAIQPVVGGDFNAPLFLSGAGAAAVAMIFSTVSGKKLVRAVEAYNGNHGKTGFRLEMSPTGTGTGAGFSLAWRFQ